MSTMRIERPGDHLVELIMDRPEALNAISSAQAEIIASACAQVSKDRTVRVVMLSSALDRAFCVGADLKERNGFSDDQLRAQRPTMRACFAAVRALPVPVIAAVDGFALGGGCELALSCDLIVAGAGATFGLPEVGVGLVPGGGGTQLLTRRLGYNRAADLVLTGRRVDATTAMQLGLADRLAVAGGARTIALELAELIATRSPVGIRNAKTALRDGCGLSLTDGLELENDAWHRTAFSPDRLEGIAAFVEKRAPHWPDQGTDE